MNKEKISEPFNTYLENKQLVNAIFLKEKISKYSNEVKDAYLRSLLRAHKNIDINRSLLEKDTIQGVVADYLKDMQWHVKYDTFYPDFDSNFKFDLVARKEKRSILVKVKPKITKQILEQLRDDISNSKKELESTRIILAADILELTTILNSSEISKRITDMVKKHRLGIVLVDKNPEYQETWLLPAEFLQTYCK